MKIEYKAIDKYENVFRGVETVNSIDELCRRLAAKNLLPIAIRMLGNSSIKTFTQLKHLKSLKKKLEHKVDQDINVDSIPAPTNPSPAKKRRRIDPVYILYFLTIVGLAVGYYMGF